MWLSSAGNYNTNYLAKKQRQKHFYYLKSKLPDPQILFEKYPHEISGGQNNVS
jgi:ABC-type dipeptide/oligopeptide/nickel transport system ATPase component